MSNDEPKIHPNGLDEIARLMKQVDWYKRSLELTVESLRKADLELIKQSALIGELRADNRALYEENTRLRELRESDYRPAGRDGRGQALDMLALATRKG